MIDQYPAPVLVTELVPESAPLVTRRALLAVGGVAAGLLLLDACTGRRPHTIQRPRLAPAETLLLQKVRGQRNLLAAPSRTRQPGVVKQRRRSH